MKPHQRLGLEQFFQDVRCVLESLEFRADQGAYREGDFCAVEVIASRPPGRPDCRLELRIIPSMPLTQPEPEVVEGVRQAFDEALADPDKRVRAAASQSRRRLRMQRLPAGALTGWLILLAAGDEADGPLASALTDERGRAIFAGIPPQTLCRLSCGTDPSWRRRGRR